MFIFVSYIPIVLFRFPFRSFKINILELVFFIQCILWVIIKFIKKIIKFLNRQFSFLSLFITWCYLFLFVYLFFFFLVM